jgi:hypothetical protein
MVHGVVGLPDAVVRFVAVLAAGSLAGTGVFLWTGHALTSPAFRARMRRDGWLRETPLPFFDEELSENARKRLARWRRPAAAPSLAALLIAVAAAALVTAFSSSHPAGLHLRGEVELRPAERVSRLWRTDTPIRSALQLPGELELLGVVDDGPASRVTIARWDVRTAERVEFVALVGETLDVFGRVLRVAEIRTDPRVRGAVVRVSTTDGGDEFEHAVYVGARQPLPSGQTLELLDTEPPSRDAPEGGVRIRVLGEGGTVDLLTSVPFGRTGAVVRHRAAGMDIEAVEPLLGRTVQLVEVERAPWALWTTLMAVVALFVFARRSTRWSVRGRSGDYVLFRVGPSHWDEAELSRTGGLLDATQETELCAILDRVSDTGDAA